MLEGETIDLKLSLGNSGSPDINTLSSPSIHQWRKTSQPPPSLPPTTTTTTPTPPIDHLHALFPKCPRRPKEGEEEHRLVCEDNGGSWSTTVEKDGGTCDGTMRKKLRLSKEQSSLLEDSFRNRHTLNSIEKRDLAQRLNLQPRQVEVWFQNRRARTKLKQTEVDKEYLRRYCERLSDENRKLREEVRALRVMKLGWPASFQVPPHAVGVTVELCPSCGKANKGNDVDGGLVKVLAVKPKLCDLSIDMKDAGMTCCK